MKLYPLFHWSPRDRRKKIRIGGLQPYSDPVVTRGGLAQTYISLSPTPSMAWSLSGNMDWMAEVEEWDLWQVQIPEKAETHVRPTYGDLIEEVKVFTVIPPDHLWFVGTRGMPYMEEVADDER